MSKGLVLSGPDKTIEMMASSRRLGVTVDPGMGLAYDKTLFVDPGTEVPWDLLPAAWHFLERWDAAVPLWRYGVTAADVGPKTERKRTEAIARDLRVLLHAVELLFIRDNADGQALLEAYREELEGSQEKRLAFLRAFYRVKPRLCVLPRSWLARVFQRSKMDATALRGKRETVPALVTVEIGPNRFVQCHEGDEQKVLAMVERRAGRRNGRSTSVKRDASNVKRETSNGRQRAADGAHTAPALVTVEIEPGRFVKCYPGDEDRVLDALTAGRGAQNGR